MMPPVVWTIAGSDSSGGAGIEADIKTLLNLGVHGCSVITALTAQNAQSVSKIAFTSAAMIAAQLNGNLPASAIKIGMLGNTEAINCLHACLETFTGHVVMDPVLVSSSGTNLFLSEMKDYIKQLETLFKFVDVFTPNIPETEKITGIQISSHQDIVTAGKVLLSSGMKSVLIKGGHALDQQFSHDYWTDGNESIWLSSPRYPEKNYRGTGCVLSSAIAAALSLGYAIKDALVIAKMYCNKGLRLSMPIDSSTALLAHHGWPEDQCDLPYLSDAPISLLPMCFPECKEMGLYPVVDDVDWIRKLLPLGVKSIQLRIKNKTGDELEAQIQQSVELARQYHARLFINDFWELAIKHGAYGVHLGQSDLNQADMHKIRQSGLRLGISTHCYYEVARAHALQPSYLACGPIFPTISKVMPFGPQGLSQLRRWRNTLSYPLVAIGGISRKNIQDVLATHVNGVAMISAITSDQDWCETTKWLLATSNKYAQDFT